MTKKKQSGEKPEEQSARFRAEVERMISAGELNPTADIDFERLLKVIKKPSSA